MFCMAVIIIVKAILAILALGVAYFMLTPVVYEIKAKALDSPNLSGAQIAQINQMYELYSYIPPMLFGAIILFSYMASTRRQTDEF